MLLKCGLCDSFTIAVIHVGLVCKPFIELSTISKYLVKQASKDVGSSAEPHWHNVKSSMCATRIITLAVQI